MRHQAMLTAWIGSAALTGAIGMNSDQRYGSAGDRLAIAADSPAVASRFTVASTGNEARYRIKEQLAGRDLPNDAVGVTSLVTGGIAFTKDWAIVPSESKFTIDVTKLKSDNDRRDGYVGRRVLETADHPNIVFAPTEIKGLKGGIPQSGSVTFDLNGNLTVRGKTRPSLWRVTATLKDGKATGSASTSFTFSEFELMQPKVPIVLSVADTIKLEYSFTLERK